MPRTEILVNNINYLTDCFSLWYNIIEDRSNTLKGGFQNETS